MILCVFSDEYRILVDMRWNKQYLDILANKCNFEDEERYMEFLDALNAVANRLEISIIMTDSSDITQEHRLFQTQWRNQYQVC